MIKILLKRYFISVLFAVVGLVSSEALAQAKIKTEPLKIEYGKSVKIVYDLGKIEKYFSPAEIKDVTIVLYKNPLMNPDKIKMQADSTTWEAKVVISDTAVKMIFWKYEIITVAGDVRKTVVFNKEGMFWDAVLCDKAGVPVKRAFQERALSFTGAGSVRKENISQALSDIQKEIDIYPDNNEARLLMYAIMLKSGRDKESIHKKIEIDIKKLGARQDPLKVKRFALRAYKLIGMGKMASKIEKELAEKDPRGMVAAQQKFEEAMKTKDSIKRMQKLEEFMKSFPASPMKNAALSGIAAAAIEVNDTVKMAEIGDILYKSATEPSAARTLAGIAGALSENGVRLSRALAYIQKAIELLNRAKTLTIPPEIDKSEWQERMQITEGRYRDILGWILFVKGRKDDAYKQLSEAVKYTRQPGVYFHYGIVLANTGRKEDALKWYARASVFGGEVSDSAYSALVELWKHLGKSDVLLESFVKKEAEDLKTSYRKKVLSHRRVSKAPDFELETVNDDWLVSLSDQRGSVVILCFWATWSRSSGFMIKMLKDLSMEWGDSVLFLTIVTDKDIQRIENYVRNKKIWLPVLINNDTDKDFGVRGVPTLYVIDKKGYINFIHKGFRPDIKDVLAIELNDLLK